MKQFPDSWDNRTSTDELRDLFFGKNASAAVMKTDIREHADGWTLEVELPGVSKEDVQLQLDQGVLTITAQRNSQKQMEQFGRLIRQERISGKFSRSYFVGEETTAEALRARVGSGILTVFIAKQDPRAARKNITIE